MGPHLKTPLNDLSTMNKTMEYMSCCLPCVAFDLQESRRSAGDTAVVLPSGDVGAFCDAVEALPDDPARRVAIGVAARDRVSRYLAWKAQAMAYVGVFDAPFGVPARAERPRRADPDGGSPWTDGMTTVDLADSAELARFVRERSAPGQGGACCRR